MSEPLIPKLLVAIPALPLVGAAAAIGMEIVSKALRPFAHVPVVIALAASCVASCLLVREVAVEQFNAETVAKEKLQGKSDEGKAYPWETTVTLWTWADIADADTEASAGAVKSYPFKIDITLRADALTAAMLAMVTFVATLVAIYASGYMDGDPGYARFFSYVGLFVFSMTMLVSVSNFVLLFVFWEAVGLCSYLLIGFWYEKPEAAEAGKKAFLVNRVGDFGFALAIFLIWTTYHTLNYHSVDGQIGVLAAERVATGDYVGGWTGTAICLLLMLGACGKSAQFPLHIWLPDAMEGPTPVSALIHAATMVTAGVYMVARCTPLFMVAPEAQLVVSVIGGGTALMAALIALTQFDLKRVMAYSTVSQLGYMFLALGTGTAAGVIAAMFHLLTHAFFKALLFLGSGSVMHAMGGVIDMRRFSGLRHLLPWTCATFLIGSLALAGVFPLAGFWSKDAILASVHDRAHDYTSAAAPADDGHGQHASPNASGASLKGLTEGQLLWYGRLYQVLYYGGLLTALLTAFYTFRAYFLTFYGEEQIPHEAGHHAHESPQSMVGPLTVLAGLAVVAGIFLQAPLTKFLGYTPSLAKFAAATVDHSGSSHLEIAIISTIAAVLGIALAAYLYLGHQREVQALQGYMDFEWVSEGWRGYVPSFYRLSLNKFYWDEIYQAVIVGPLEYLAWLCYVVDRWLVDGLVNFVGWIPGLLGGGVRTAQIGLVPFYALVMAIGLILILAAKVLLAG